MKRSVMFLLASGLAGFASLAGAEIKIGVVNTDQLLANSPQYKTAQEAINAEFLPRQQEIQALDQQLKTRQDKLQKDGPTMTEMQRNQADKEVRDRTRELQLKQSSAEEDFNARRDEEMQKLQRILRDEVAAFAKAGSYDLILAGSAVAYASNAVDVTTSMVDAIKKRAGVATTPAAATPAAAKPAAASPAPNKPAAPKAAAPRSTSPLDSP